MRDDTEITLDDGVVRIIWVVNDGKRFEVVCWTMRELQEDEEAMRAAIQAIIHAAARGALSVVHKIGLDPGELTERRLD